MQKVEDALQWLYKAKNDARKALQACAGTGQGVQALKSALSSKVQEVLRFQLKLEEVKISGQGEFQETKALLSNTAKALPRDWNVHLWNVRGTFAQYVRETRHRPYVRETA